ncbi:MAG TPA: aminotransferase class V-fold PLP-dependent enzyme [Chitinophagaceae bacterium]|nr:aminotransferase class V-fold PLP-dependent enzyme [Chitinophagaceae bacterium]
MLSSQKHLFQLPADITYLNCAYMSPLLQSSVEAGVKGILRKANPASIKAEDFFSDSEEIKIKAGLIIQAAPQQIAIVPSASYGIKAAVNNLPVNNGNHAITVAEEFPSVYYTIESWCRTNSKELKIITPPATQNERGKKWNEKLLESINNDTAVVAISSIHWTDGTKFDLKAIGERCKEVNAMFIVDGTQSVGALPMNVHEYKIDALICAGYKWLLSPYTIGIAYYSEYFNNGKPIEDTWLNKTNAVNFARLVDYVNAYKPAAGRYNSGEYSNFILTPMFNDSLQQLINWGIENIQEYCAALIQPLTALIQQKEFWIEDKEYRTNHLFGFGLPSAINKTQLLETLQQRKIFVSLRSDAVRISPHLYNDERDIIALMEIIGAL